MDTEWKVNTECFGVDWSLLLLSVVYLVMLCGLVSCNVINPLRMCEGYRVVYLCVCVCVCYQAMSYAIC